MIDFLRKLTARRHPVSIEVSIPDSTYPSLPSPTRKIIAICALLRLCESQSGQWAMHSNVATMDENQSKVQDFFVHCLCWLQREDLDSTYHHQMCTRLCSGSVRQQKVFLSQWQEGFYGYLTWKNGRRLTSLNVNLPDCSSSIGFVIVIFLQSHSVSMLLPWTMTMTTLAGNPGMCIQLRGSEKWS